MWELVNFGKDLTIQEILCVIDDSMCYGFEFKVENHSIFWREKTE